MVHRAVALFALGLAACGRVNFGPSSDARTSDGAGSDGGTDSGGPMTAPSFAQRKEIADPLTSATVNTLTLDQDVAAGDLLIVYGDDFDPAPTLNAVTDTLGNTFTLVPRFTGSNYVQNIAYAISTSSGPDMVTTTLSAPRNAFYELQVWVYKGVDPVQPFDGITHAAGAGGGVDSASAPTLTTTVANELLVGYCLDGFVSGGTGFTVRANPFNDALEEGPAPTPGDYTVTASPGGDWIIIAMALRPRA